MNDDAVKVTVSDPETGEVLDEVIVHNDYTIICAGTCYIDGLSGYANGTHVLTIKGRG